MKAIWSCGRCGTEHEVIVTVRNSKSSQVWAEQFALIEATNKMVRTLRDLITRQCKILDAVAMALSGEPPRMPQWSHHDLPERARYIVAEVERLREENKKLFERLEPGMCADPTKDPYPTSRERRITYVCAVCGGFARSGEDSLDTGTTLICSLCAGKTVVSLHTTEGYTKEAG